MIAIVTAGGEIEPNQPLYEVSRGGLKSMIDIAGKPMVQWVLDALGQSNSVERVIVVGLPLEIDLVCNVPLILLPDTGSVMGNIRVAAEEVLRIDPGASHAFLVAGDIPALRTEMIDWLACHVADLEEDVYYTLIEREVMEERFPEVKFSYTHLKNMQVCNGQIHCFRVQTAFEESPLWKRLIDSRSTPFRQASILGYDAMLFLLLRQLSLQDAQAAINKRLSVRGKAVLCPYPEVGMSVDKPLHIELMRTHLQKNSESYAADPDEA